MFLVLHTKNMLHFGKTSFSYQPKPIVSRKLHFFPLNQYLSRVNQEYVVFKKFSSDSNVESNTAPTLEPILI